MIDDPHIFENSGLLLSLALAVSTFFTFMIYLILVIRPIAGILALIFGAPILWWIVGKLMEKPLEK